MVPSICGRYNVPNSHDIAHFCFIIAGDEVWSQGFGKSDIARGKMVDSDTRFEIGSVTKAFTATLLGILLSENG